MASTGISGLDNVLYGGLPSRHLYLVEGNPGTGKTTLGLQFLLAGRAQGERGLYITLSETSQELAQVAASHGWTLEGMDVYDLVSDEGLSEEAEQTILHPSELELGETTRDVMRLVVREAISTTSIGLAIGLGLGVLLGWGMSFVIYGVSPYDPITLGGATGVLGLSSIIASIIPAKRAASVLPMTALRDD